MSTTPLLQGILTSLMTILVGILTVVSNVTNTEATDSTNFLQRINLTHFSGLAVFIIFLAVSASFSVYVRSNEILGLNPEKFAEKWQSNAYSKDEIKRRLFDKVYAKDSLSEEKQKQMGNTLYAMTVSECTDLQRAQTKDELLSKLISLEEHDERIKKFLSKTQDSVAIFAFREILCP